MSLENMKKRIAERLRLYETLNALEVRHVYKDAPNILVVTIDSLRFDVARRVGLPQTSRYAGQDLRWRRVYSPGTYTLPSHMSFFQAGIFPATKDEDAEPIYNRDKLSLFRPVLAWHRNKPALYPLPPASNIVRGLEQVGYRTIGIGGVNWFNTDFPTSAFWSESFFQEFIWRRDFSEDNPDAFEYQIESLQKLQIGNERLFVFVNVASTHYPYREGGAERHLEQQERAMQYVDLHLPGLLGCCPRPVHVILLSDHGDCFGEDGLFGHGFYHPKIMEVPMVHFWLE